MKLRKNRESVGPAAGDNVQQATSPRAAAGPQSISFKQALEKIVSPALRLHHYRTVYNRLLHNAWCKLDSPAYRECRVDE